MPVKQKNIPTQAQVKNAFQYLDKEFGEYEGRLIPKEFYFGKPKEFVMMYMEHVNPGGIRRLQDGSTVRYFAFNSGQYTEDKLIWLYHKGKYPQTAIHHIDGDKLNSKINNLELTNNIYVSASGYPGVYQMKSGHYAWMWRAEHTVCEFEEVPVDKDGKPIVREWWEKQGYAKTKGWNKRKTKIISKRNRTLVGYYLTFEEAKRQLKGHQAEQYAIGRYQHDLKLRQLVANARTQIATNPSYTRLAETKGEGHALTWVLLKTAYYAKTNYGRHGEYKFTEDEIMLMMDALGHGDRFVESRG